MSKSTSPIYIYTHDGNHKVNIATATLLGDVNRDKNIDRQGDRTQLWRTKSGQYFTGSCLDFVLSSNNPIEMAKFFHPVLITKDQARTWVTHYYGGNGLVHFGFEDADEV